MNIYRMHELLFILLDFRPLQAAINTTSIPPEIQVYSRRHVGKDVYLRVRPRPRRGRCRVCVRV